MPTELQIYTQTLLQVYLALADTPDRYSSFDRTLAQKLFQQQVSLPWVKAAFALASLRRHNRPSDALPLPPIRSLAYFLPVIEELRTAPHMYWDYCWNCFQSGQRNLITLP
jgi:hypothetical protein